MKAIAQVPTTFEYPVILDGIIIGYSEVNAVLHVDEDGDLEEVEIKPFDGKTSVFVGRTNYALRFTNGDQGQAARFWDMALKDSKDVKTRSAIIEALSMQRAA